MFKIYCMLIFVCLTSLLYGEDGASRNTQGKTLKFHIFTDFNGKGLEADMRVLKDALEKLGHSVEAFSSYSCSTQFPFADINVFFERIAPQALPFARFNWFVSNPEWIQNDEGTLHKIDLFLCRTREVERIFQSRHQPTYFLSFASKDYYQPDIVKDYTRFCHVAGGSFQKGTGIILDLWNRNAQLPQLTVVKHFDLPLSRQPNLVTLPHQISWGSLLSLQNRCGVHLCPSETEGFGHSILEAMSTCAVVITTDAPPMNEFIKDPRCLVPYSHTAPKGLAINYYVDQNQLENTVKNISTLSVEELRAIGEHNRSVFLEKKQEFTQNLEVLVHMHL